MGSTSELVAPCTRALPVPAKPFLQACVRGVDVADLRANPYGCQPLRKATRVVELRRDDDMTRGVDEESFAASRHQGQTFMELIRSIEL